MPFVYEGVAQEMAYRIDWLVEDKVIVALKSVECFMPSHFVQTLTYLRLSKLKLALLITFNTIAVKDGIRLIINNL